jgi:hypothetical protein
MTFREGSAGRASANLVGLAAGLVVAGTAWGQPRAPWAKGVSVDGQPAPHLNHKVYDPGAPGDDAPAISDREAERQMKRIRAKHFGTVRNTEVRQLGISKMREFTDPLLFPTMLEVFGREADDVRNALLDHFADQACDQGDASLGYVAVFGKDEAFRKAATERLQGRVAQLHEAGALEQGDAPWRIKAIISNGVQQSNEAHAGAAAQLAEQLRLFELIPTLINAQVRGNTTGVADDGGAGALAYILVGTQQAFVSDLTPVVGDSAVAFDPTLSVVTDGVVLRVIDAVVVTYRVEIHNALVGLANAGWDGRRTDGLGWDQKAWEEWYTKEFLPYRRALAAAGKK